MAKFMSHSRTAYWRWFLKKHPRALESPLNPEWPSLAGIRCFCHRVIPNLAEENLSKIAGEWSLAWWILLWSAPLAMRLLKPSRSILRCLSLTRSPMTIIPVSCWLICKLIMRNAGQLRGAPWLGSVMATTCATPILMLRASLISNLTSPAPQNLHRTSN